MKKSIKITTAACPTPVWCIGTYDENDKPNIMTIAWGGIACSVPPHLTISVRKATYTYNALISKKCYTVSIPSSKYIKEADYFGMVSGKDTDKFAVTGLTPIRSDIVDAPYIDEFLLIFECAVKNIVEIGGHIQFIGEIMGIKADENILNNNEVPIIEKINPFIYAPTTKEYRSINSVIGHGFKSGQKFIQ